jgi:hypothetical protein
MHDVAERVTPFLVHWKFDFLEARLAVIGGMEPGDLHRCIDSMKYVCAGNDDVVDESGRRR